MYLSLDESLVGGGKIVWPSSFLTCCHDGGRGCRSTVLRGDYYCDSWSEQTGKTTRQSASLCSREVSNALSAWS